MNASLSHAPIIIRIIVAALILGLIAQSREIIGDVEFTLSDWQAYVNPIGLFAVSLLAPIFYLFAVWASAEAIERIHSGDAFGAVMVKGLRDIGSNLMWGAGAAVVISPTLTGWIDERFRGVRFDADIASVTIGVLGGVLWLVAAQGEKLKTEMDSFI